MYCSPKENDFSVLIDSGDIFKINSLYFSPIISRNESEVNHPMENKLTQAQKDDLKAMMSLPESDRHTMTVLAAGMMLASNAASGKEQPKEAQSH